LLEPGRVRALTLLLLNYQHIFRLLLQDLHELNVFPECRLAFTSKKIAKTQDVKPTPNFLESKQESVTDHLAEAKRVQRRGTEFDFERGAKAEDGEESLSKSNSEETSATDCDISEPRLVTALVEHVEGLQRHLQVLSKGIKEITRSKRCYQKAYRRRERRRAARQKEVVCQPQFPADHPQKPAIVEGNGNKAEEGTQSPQDWEPSKEEEARSDRVDISEGQQLLGCWLADTQTQTSQKGSNREDMQLS
jgi:hypothetical protein